jgi:predicted enzyme related to lactoylglutathione lyase
MTTRDHPPAGAPCWVDLWTSDVDGSRAFYAELFGWEAQEPSEEFGGYFMWTRNGDPIAGGMGDMGDMKADNAWKTYLATDDIAATVAAAEKAGAQIMGEASPVADLGIQAVMIDPTGAAIGTWQEGTFPGFTVLDEQSAPSWFELHTRDFSGAVAFYESVWGVKTDSVGDTDEFRYSTVRNPAGEGEIAGMMDSSSFLPATQSPHWKIYWHVDDIDATVAKVTQLGGSVETPVENTPYGKLAGVVDPSGARFSLRTPPAG